jgi:hypothetical protein
MKSFFHLFFIMLFAAAAQQHPPLELRGDTTDQGQQCYMITTESATYFYQKEGCGFSSILDQQGNDWIGYQPGGGERGEYRGIPNLGWEFHPGYTNGGTTEVVTEEAYHIHLRSEANGWQVSWHFYNDRAMMVLEQALEPYWFLYEGTPGGTMEPDRDYYYLPGADGVARMECSQGFSSDLVQEWIAFGDPASAQMLLLVHHTNDELIDSYFPMGGSGGMTVFGFGRDNDRSPCWHCMEQQPDTFTVALTILADESAAQNAAQEYIDRARITSIASVHHRNPGSPVRSDIWYSLQGRRITAVGGTTRLAGTALRLLLNAQNQNLVIDRCYNE